MGEQKKTKNKKKQKQQNPQKHPQNQKKKKKTTLLDIYAPCQGIIGRLANSGWGAVREDTAAPVRRKKKQGETH